MAKSTKPKKPKLSLEGSGDERTTLINQLAGEIQREGKGQITHNQAIKLATKKVDEVLGQLEAPITGPERGTVEASRTAGEKGSVYENASTKAGTSAGAAAELEAARQQQAVQLQSLITQKLHPEISKLPAEQQADILQKVRALNDPEINSRLDNAAEQIQGVSEGTIDHKKAVKEIERQLGMLRGKKDIKAKLESVLSSTNSGPAAPPLEHSPDAISATTSATTSTPGATPELAEEATSAIKKPSRFSKIGEFLKKNALGDLSLEETGALAAKSAGSWSSLGELLTKSPAGLLAALVLGPAVLHNVVHGSVDPFVQSRRDDQLLELQTPTLAERLAQSRANQIGVRRQLSLLSQQDPSALQAFVQEAGRLDQQNAGPQQVPGRSYSGPNPPTGY
jgi:hypothetical protein